MPISKRPFRTDSAVRKEGVHPGNRIDRGYILLLEHHLGRTDGAAIESSKRRMEDGSSL